jgi:hypothetical protein
LDIGSHHGEHWLGLLQDPLITSDEYRELSRDRLRCAACDGSIEEVDSFFCQIGSDLDCPLDPDRRHIDDDRPRSHRVRDTISAKKNTRHILSSRHHRDDDI